MANLFSSTRPLAAEEGAKFASGLSVAGRSLEPPQFHNVCWQVGQTFSAEDDPDRTIENWQAPNFISKDMTNQQANTSVEELELPWKPFPQSFARVVHNVLSEEDCAALIHAVNVKGFTPALLNVGGGCQQLAPGCRDGFRVTVDSEPLTAWLLEVLRPYLPESLSDGDEAVQLHSLNERCRFLCYTPGQTFAEHHDGRFTHPRTHAVSKVTIQLYLHDVPLENGGATTFLFRGFPNVPCQPGAGSVLIFTQDLLHEGSLLSKGLKYTFRTEAMYSDVRVHTNAVELRVDAAAESSVVPPPFGFASGLGSAFPGSGGSSRGFGCCV